MVAIQKKSSFEGRRGRDWVVREEGCFVDALISFLLLSCSVWHLTFGPVLQH